MRNLNWYVIGLMIWLLMFGGFAALFVAVVDGVRQAGKSPVICVHQPEPNVQVWVVRQGKCEPWEKQK